MTKINVEAITKSSKNKFYEIKTREYIPYINFLDEWIKFTSVLTKEELELIKNDISFTDNDFYKIQNVKNIQRMNYIFKKYKAKKCNNEEYLEAQKYMDNSISEFMDTRLSEDEKDYAKCFADTIQEENPEIIKDYIFTAVEKYDELSLADAYILRIVISNYIDKINKECNEKIIEESKERNISLRKSLIKEYGNLIHR